MNKSRLTFVLSLVIVLVLFIHRLSKDHNLRNIAELHLPKDLLVTTWAESPMLYNPTNMDVDKKGRIWVTEAVNYRNFNNDTTDFLHHDKGDRIVILEDTDQDGKADSSKVFVQDKDLVSPLGIAVLGNKVVVSCAPNVIVYTDNDGDDVPDEKEIFLTGFGGLDHDHSVHAFVAGPDGKWYFNTGNAGPHHVTDKSGFTIHSGSLYTGGTPYNKKNTPGLVSDDGGVYVGGLAMEIDPDGKGLRVLSHNFRNSYELCIDSFGDVWQNDNDDQVVTCRVSWLMNGSNAGYFSEDGSRYWGADQRPGQDMFTAHWHQEDPGVLPAGDNTGSGAPTGVLVYEGDALGANYRGMFLSADAGRNVIFSYKPEVEGAGFRLKGLRKNLVSSLPLDNEGYVWYDKKLLQDTAKWFRPSDVVVGTDGALYVADWYDPVVGGHQMREREGYGRIYRIAPKKRKLRNPDLSGNNLQSLLKILKSPATNVRYEAVVKLKEAGEKAIEPVASLLQSENPYHVARALWLLPSLGEKGRELVQNYFENTNNARLQVAAFRALLQNEDKKSILELCELALKTEEPMLWREALTSVKDFGLPEKKQLIVHGADRYSGKDPFLLEAIGIAVGKDSLAGEVITAEFMSRFGDDEEKLLRLLWRIHSPSATNYFREMAASPSLDPFLKEKAVTGLGFVKSRDAVEAMIALSEEKDQRVKEQALYWLSFRRHNEWKDLYDWSSLPLNLESEQKKAEILAMKEKVLNRLIDINDRARTMKRMVLDSMGGIEVLKMLREGTIPKDLYETVSAHIFDNPDNRIRFEAEKLMDVSDTIRYSEEEIIEIAGNYEEGKEAFKGKCQVCHVVRGEGRGIGPDLSEIGNKFDRKELIREIIEPSGTLAFGFQAWEVTTVGGDVYNGFLEASDEVLIIKDLAGQRHYIDKNTIKQSTALDKSVMPRPASLSLSKQEIADIVNYLTK